MVLVYYSRELALILCGDASPCGVEAVLAHKIPDNREACIGFGSRTLQPAEKNFSQPDKEALSIISSRKFVIVTAFGVIWCKKKTDITAHIAKNVTMVTDVRYDMKYREGNKHYNADAMHRLPLKVHFKILVVPQILY